MVIFGDSLSDVGNVQALFKELTGEDKPPHIIEKPFKAAIAQLRAPAPLKELLNTEVDLVAKGTVDLISKTGAISVIPYPPYYKGRFSNGPV